jgi:hypothetical protein
VTTVVFFESNGGQARAEATVPELRLAVAEPELDVGHVDAVLEALGSSCYYLTGERTCYRFSLSPNLNKLLADRRASIQPAKIEERVRAEVREVFAKGSGVDRVYFPEKSNQVPDRPAPCASTWTATGRSRRRRSRRRRWRCASWGWKTGSTWHDDRQGGRGLAHPPTHDTLDRGVPNETAGDDP